MERKIVFQRKLLFLLIVISQSICSLAFSQTTMVVDERLPVEGVPTSRIKVGEMYSVVSPTGELVFLSENKRYLFRGEFIDLRNGNPISSEGVKYELDLNRFGFDLNEVGIDIGKGQQDQVLFLSPDCEDCKTLVSSLISSEIESKYKTTVVLLSTTGYGNLANIQIWCSKNRENGLLDVFIESKTPEDYEPGAYCDQFGLYKAEQAAIAFGISQLPILVTNNGLAIEGLLSIQQEWASK